MVEEYQVLWTSLDAAARKITELYFRLPVAGLDMPISRERAYCYELFHQMRLCLPTDFPFTLHGEIDKRGHPLYGPCVHNANPDFVVHIPGRPWPDANLAVIEVKAGTVRTTGLNRDVVSLCRFIDCIGYHRGIQLVFGGNGDRVQRTITQAMAPFDERRGRIEVWWHRDVGEGLQQLW